MNDWYDDTIEEHTGGNRDEYCSKNEAFYERSRRNRGGDEFSSSLIPEKKLRK